MRSWTKWFICDCHFTIHRDATAYEIMTLWSPTFAHRAGKKSSQGHPRPFSHCGISPLQHTAATQISFGSKKSAALVTLPTCNFAYLEWSSDNFSHARIFHNDVIFPKWAASSESSSFCWNNDNLLFMTKRKNNNFWANLYSEKRIRKLFLRNDARQPLCVFLG